MRWTFFIETGRCGWGYSAGFLPEIRLGLIRFSWLRGSFLDAVRDLAKRRPKLTKSLDDICAERRARDAAAERKHPRNARSGQFVEKGMI
ncbi:MAG TPA: hypothetical protein PK231_09350 [Acidocella sp.]|nr:hypothetical protein [Acidocella sp.]